MSLSTQLAAEQRKFADAAKAMKKIGEECRENPPEQMPDKFNEAKADLEAAKKAIDRLKDIEAQASAADEAYASAYEPDASRPIVIPRPDDPDLPVQASKRRAHAERTARHTRTGRNYLKHERHIGVGEKAHSSSFNTYLRHGAAAFSVEATKGGWKPEIKNALMTSSGELGGFLVPPDFRRELLSDVAAQSILFRLARRIPTTTNEAAWPTMQSDATSPRIYRSGFRGTWRVENELGQPGVALTAQNQPKFETKRIPVHSWIPDPVLVTPEQMEDSAFDMEAMLSDLIAEHLALEMDDMCLVSGTGSGEPTAIMHANSGVSTVTTSASAAIDYNAFIDLVFSENGVAAQYRAGAVIVMNTATYADLLQLNDGSDRPLINVFTAPDSVYGYPIEFSEHLAVPATTAKVAIFGNFMHYGVAERTDLRIQRLEEKHAPNITFLPRARFGGDVLRPNAFRILQCAA